MGKMLGLEIEALKGDWRRAVDPAAVEGRLKRDRAGAIKAILVVQIDTASGVVNDIPAIRSAIDAANIRPCCWSIAWPRLAACRLPWTTGASMSPCAARRKD